MVDVGDGLVDSAVSLFFFPECLVDFALFAVITWFGRLGLSVTYDAVRSDSVVRYKLL